MSHEHHHISSLQYFYSITVFRLITKRTSKLCIIGPLQCESIGNCWIPHKRPVNGKRFRVMMPSYAGTTRLTGVSYSIIGTYISLCFYRNVQLQSVDQWSISIAVGIGWIAIEHCLKSLAFCPHIQIMCHWNLDLIFKAKLKLINLIWLPGGHLESGITKYW